jgi:hypothetical protein
MENETPTVQDLITLSYEQKPLEFQDVFNSLILDRVAKAVDTRKVEVAQSMFAPEQAEPEIESEPEVTDQKEPENVEAA